MEGRGIKERVVCKVIENGVYEEDLIWLLDDF